MTSHPIRSGVTCALLLIGTVLLLGACAAGPNELVDTGPDPAGFWLGLWQGLISPITFIVSLFTTNVNVYEVQNNGNWYDFGFMLGVACAFGSGGGGRHFRSAAYAEAQPRLDSCNGSAGIRLLLAYRSASWSPDLDFGGRPGTCASWFGQGINIGSARRRETRDQMRGGSGLSPLRAPAEAAEC